MPPIRHPKLTVLLIGLAASVCLVPVNALAQSKLGHVQGEAVQELYSQCDADLKASRDNPALFEQSKCSYYMRGYFAGYATGANVIYGRASAYYYQLEENKGKVDDPETMNRLSEDLQGVSPKCLNIYDYKPPLTAREFAAAFAQDAKQHKDKEIDIFDIHHFLMRIGDCENIRKAAQEYDAQAAIEKD